MARRKKGSYTLLPWLSGRIDNKDGRYIQVGNSFHLDKRVHALGHTARLLYECMCQEAGGQREVVFTRGTARKFGFPKATFERNVQKLIDCGFLTLKENAERSQYAPNIYRFSLEWKITSAPQIDTNKE